jgi:hypothetical protein
MCLHNRLDQRTEREGLGLALTGLVPNHAPVLRRRESMIVPGRGRDAVSRGTSRTTAEDLLRRSGSSSVPRAWYYSSS